MAGLRLLLTLLTIVAAGKLVDGVFNCPADDGFTCSSCSSLVYCSGGKVAMELPCPGDQLCGGEPKVCRDSTDASLTDCKCGSEYPSYVKDPYDDQRFFICLSASLQVSGTCPEGQVFVDGANPPCAAGPTTTTQPPLECTESGIFPVLPGCSGYYGCSPDASGGFTASAVTDCDGDKVFDPEARACVDSIDPAEVTCVAGKIAVADPVECNAFHICNDAGEVVSGPICCPGEGQVFNSETMLCEPDTGKVKCPTPNPCAPESQRSCLPPTTTPLASSATPLTSGATPLSSGATPITSGATPLTSGATPLTSGATPQTNKATPSTDSTIKTDSPATSTSLPDCSSGTGVYPVPGDCKKYYYCFNGKLYTLSCAGQLIFNPENSTCDLPTNYPQCA